MEGELMTVRQVMKEIEELEPRNIVDYIFRGSGLTRFMKKHNMPMGVGTSNDPLDLPINT